MTARTVTAYVVDCDVTGCRESLENGDWVMRFDTPADGHQAAIDDEWTDLGGGRLACTRDNEAHDRARAGRRPAA